MSEMDIARAAHQALGRMFDKFRPLKPLSMAVKGGVPVSVKAMAGEWVADSEMHPTTNVYARAWWVSDDLYGVYRGTWPTKTGMKPDNLFWLFTPEQC